MSEWTERGRNSGNVCTAGCKSLTEYRGHVALLGTTCRASTDAEASLCQKELPLLGDGPSFYIL